MATTQNGAKEGKEQVQSAINNVMQKTNTDAVKKMKNGDGENKTVMEEIKGYDFNKGVDYDKLFGAYLHTGFQATNFAKAVNEINRMIACKKEPVPEDKADTQKTNCNIFLGYTSNMISSGVREYIRYLVQHKMVDCIVCTAGGIEEDFIKCMAPTMSGAFDLSGEQLRNDGINRIGNLLVPNDNYCKFEDWVMPILDALVDEHLADPENVKWTPSKIINRLGKEINNEESVYYWAWKNDIPVYSPALTDGSLGDMMYFHSYRKPGLVVDILEDLRTLNNQAVRSCNTGMIILGGGLIKHHILNANLMRNGADFSVFVNTASEYDGSDAGASPDEAVSWGKIKRNAKPVKVFAEASLVFPLLVAQTFVKNFSTTTTNKE